MYKAPMKILCIDDCAVSAKREKALQKRVLEFHWDKEECFFDEIDDFDDYDLGSDNSDSDYDGPAQWKDSLVGTTQFTWGWCENDFDW